MDLSPATVRGYLYDLNHFETWLIDTSDSGLSLTSVVAVDIAAYRQQMIEADRMKAASVNGTYGFSPSSGMQMATQ